MMRIGVVITLTILIPSLSCQLFQLPPPQPSTAIVESLDPIKIELVDVTMVYYEINGSTANELREEMNRLGPVNPDDGLRYDARTNWYISWNWPGYGTSECDLSQVRVNYDIEIIAPFWKPIINIDSALVEQWNRYMTALALHEQGHVDITVDHYLKVRDVIQNATCDTAEQAAQEVIEEIRSLQAEYDEQTKHGNLQGAVFP